MGLSSLPVSSHIQSPTPSPTSSLSKPLCTLTTADQGPTASAHSGAHSFSPGSLRQPRQCAQPMPHCRGQSGLPKSDLTSLPHQKPPGAPHCFRVKLTLLSLAHGPFSPAYLTPRHTQIRCCWKTSHALNASVNCPSQLSLSPSHRLCLSLQNSTGPTSSEKSSWPD